MSTETKEYFERRAREERQRAEDAGDPAAYRAHLEMARQYETKILALERGGDAVVRYPLRAPEGQDNPRAR